MVERKRGRERETYIYGIKILQYLETENDNAFEPEKSPEVFGREKKRRERNTYIYGFRKLSRSIRI